MNKELLTIALAFGCIASNATTNNYDLLGRKGSKMNTPMVYKNVDYSKAKKNEQQKLGSSLNNASLMKTGMHGNYVAIKGAFLSNTGSGLRVFGPDGDVLVDNGQHYLRRYTSSGAESCEDLHFCAYDWNKYRNGVQTYSEALSKAFIQMNEDYNTTPIYPGVPRTNLSSAGYSYSDWKVNDNHVQSSPYQSGQTIQYTDFFDVLKDKLGYYSVSDWYLYKKSDVGISIDVETPPVDLQNNGQVKYLEYGNGPYTKSPGYEIDASRTYQLLTDYDHYDPIVYAGKGMPDNPASRNPQIYIGVHNNKKGSGNTSRYTAKARDIDNYIYNNRTIEFVSAGDFGFHTKGNPKMDPQAFAVNAITVGAFDPIGEEVLTYTSTASNVGTSYTGATKPEVYNYSNFFTHDLTRYYSNGTQSYVFRPLYDGTRVATALTAGMVGDLLAVNPFYRWHPEIVKALLLTCDKHTPTYKYLVFDNAGSTRYQFDSRYWNGDIDKLKTRTNSNGQHEIWFVAPNPMKNYPVYAAISWLSSGDDVINIGKVPQDFDLYVYGSSDHNYDNIKNPMADLRTSNFNFNKPGTFITSSNHLYRSFERVVIESSYDYLVFKIVLKDEDSRSANKGQIVLGFNMATSYFPRDLHLQ